MRNDNFLRWTQAGNIYFWNCVSSPHGLAGFHFACDESAVDGLATALRSLTASPGPRKLQAHTSEPPVSLLAGIGHVGQIDVPRTVVIRLLDTAKESAPIEVFPQEASVILNLGTAELNEFLEALTSLKTGEGDFGLGLGPADSDYMTMWWLVR